MQQICDHYALKQTEVSFVESVWRQWLIAGGHIVVLDETL